MTTLRSECRATLAWCLDHPEGFTQRECYEHFQIHQVAISKNFCRLEDMGLLRREQYKGRQFMFFVVNQHAAQAIVDEKPNPHSDYVPVNQRSNRVKNIKASKWQGVNSVFAMR